MEKLQRYQTPLKPADDKHWDTLTRYIGQIEEAHARVLEDVTSRAQLDTALLESQALLAASTTLVKHKLGRKVRGFKLVDASAQSTVWRDTASTADLTTYLPLKCSADVTVSLEVF